MARASEPLGARKVAPWQTRRRAFLGAILAVVPGVTWLSRRRQPQHCLNELSQLTPNRITDLATQGLESMREHKRLMDRARWEFDVLYGGRFVRPASVFVLRERL